MAFGIDDNRYEWIGYTSRSNGFLSNSNWQTQSLVPSTKHRISRGGIHVRIIKGTSIIDSHSTRGTSHWDFGTYIKIHTPKFLVPQTFRINDEEP